MRALLPRAIDLHDDDAVRSFVAGEVRRRDDGRPWVVANMVTTVDGAATLDGRSGGLGGPTDRLVFGTLRDLADVILVGAETVRSEGYHLAGEPHPTAAAARAADGRDERARLCIVSRTGDLGDAPLVADVGDAVERLGSSGTAAWQRPIVATGTHPDAATHLARSPGLEHRVLPDGEDGDGVDLAALLEGLGSDGHRVVVCEGGPALLAQLAAAGLVDEFDFTIAPIVAAGDAIRPTRSEDPWGGRLRLDRLAVDEDSVLFARYLRDEHDG